MKQKMRPPAPCHTCGHLEKHHGLNLLLSRECHCLDCEPRCKVYVHPKTRPGIAGHPARYGEVPEPGRDFALINPPGAAPLPVAWEDYVQRLEAQLAHETSVGQKLLDQSRRKDRRLDVYENALDQLFETVTDPALAEPETL